MKIFTTKYALTTGIAEYEVSATGEAGEYVYYSNPARYIHMQFRIGTDAFLTREEAVAAAEDMRTRKIASLRKQIARIEKKVF